MTPEEVAVALGCAGTIPITLPPEVAVADGLGGAIAMTLPLEVAVADGLVPPRFPMMLPLDVAVADGLGGVAPMTAAEEVDVAVSVIPPDGIVGVTPQVNTAVLTADPFVQPRPPEVIAAHPLASVGSSTQGKFEVYAHNPESAAIIHVEYNVDHWMDEASSTLLYQGLPPIR